jgi:hypothetical protein
VWRVISLKELTPLKCLTLYKPTLVWRVISLKELTPLKGLTLYKPTLMWRVISLKELTPLNHQPSCILNKTTHTHTQMPI